MPFTTSYVVVPPNHPFPIQNLPYGVFTTAENATKHIGIAIGDMILDLTELEKTPLLELHCSVTQPLFNQGSLLPLMQSSKEAQKKLRYRLQELLSNSCPELRDAPALKSTVFIEQNKASMHLPGNIGNYTDFFSSIDHAYNTGCMFRDKDHALLPNYRHLPVAYHGRASSIITSGQTIKRPQGQILPKDSETPIFAPSRALDFELEMAFLVGRGNPLGEPIAIEQAYDHIFGLVILNDWSARDIQRWEYIPLGPFLSKSFATSISPWVVTLEALEPFKTPPRLQTPPPLAYLHYAQDTSYKIELEVALLTPTMSQPEIICRSNYSSLYWTMAQQLAHHTVAGCNAQTMDLMASGTISGSEQGSYGSLLELGWNGTKPLKLANGETRTFLQDEDEIVITAYCQGEGYRVGFGEVRGKIVPCA